MPSNLIVQAPADGVRLITLHRPQALNALNTALLEELAAELNAADQDPQIRAVVITGSRKAFAAGADINEMAQRDLVGILDDPRVSHWQRIAGFGKPLIAAVNGFALGGGCELVMCADIVIAGSDARFGQPEINLGILPGAGGTQRLLRAVGKPLAMQMVLGGEAIGARHALQAGLVSEVTEPELTVERALQVAVAIAAKAPLAVRLPKEAPLQAQDMDLATGLRFELHAFTLLARPADRHEVTRAFQEHSPARFPRP
ncbi:2,3-dehydroadipyl-CoA hydratase [Pseudomonas soli]|uniref:2,3-dehydroadipyl-CoA hydratase PaaF n=1 Tax=Pseudomonas soli TaxID=1306993 RepID=UPI00299E9610|nr:2,3-dehydroadipyl-CoA hydratase PaaF [Pseudomonas soli]MDW9405696.1 2,3-dehydroadipyl-CoA hydratase [Pseudomonas soli]